MPLTKPVYNGLFLEKGKLHYNRGIAIKVKLPSAWFSSSHTDS
jgi:hypothetical protein